MVLASIRLKNQTSFKNIIGESKSQIFEDYPNAEHCHFVCENLELSRSFQISTNDKKMLEALTSFFESFTKTYKEYENDKILLKEWIQIYLISRKNLTNIENCKNLKEPQK